MAASRRDFIRTVLLASGMVLTNWDDLKALSAKPSTHVSTLNFSKAHLFFRDQAARPVFPDSKKKYDVIVIGAGAAGLAAAWRFRDEGKHVLVIENETNAGGVMRTPLEWNGIKFPTGASYFYEFTGASADFFKALKSSPVPTGEDGLFVSKDQIAVDWWNPAKLQALQLTTTDKEAFVQFAEKVRTVKIPEYPLRKVSADAIRKYDSVRAQSFVSEFKSDFLNEVLNLYAHSTLGASLNEVNLYSFLSFYARELGAGPNGACYTYPGGLGELTARAVDAIGKDNFRTNAVAVNLFNYSDGSVDVNYLDTMTGETFTVTAHAVVVSVSKRIASAIIPDLPADRREAMRSVPYAPYITISLCCNAPLFSARAFSFWLGDKQRLFTDVIDVTAPFDAAAGNPNRMTGKFIYQMCCPRPEAERPNLLDNAWVADYAQRAVDALAIQIPDAPAKIEEMQVFSWGHSMIIPQVGLYQRLPGLISPPFGRIYFTGADSDLAPSVNNAVDAALDTAEEVLKKI